MLTSRSFYFSRGYRAAPCFATMLALGAVFMFAASAMSAIVVQDTWGDGTDNDALNDPVAPTYSENGVDTDTDGDIESVWYQGGGGTLDPVGLGGPERGSGFGTSSASWTTYFTPEGSEVELANAGDQLCVKWVFTTGAISTTTNTSQNFRMAVVDSPSLTRINSDSSPGGGNYTGYAIFGNGGPELGRTTPFQLKTRGDVVTGGNLLSSSGEWSTVAGEAENGTTGNSGYEASTEYTFLMTIERRANGNLDIEASMTGGSLNDGIGLLTTASDVTPNGGSYKFDTFTLRPSNELTTSTIFDTSLFEVQLKSGGVIPEPASIMLLGLGSLALLMWRRRS